jgi:hypothetical protein
MDVLSTPSFNKDVSKIKDGKLTGRIIQIIKVMRSAASIYEVSGVKNYQVLQMLTELELQTID